MNSKAQMTQASSQESIGHKSRFATFTFLDAGCAISSSQAEKLLASIAKLWRRTVGRLG